MNAIKNQARLFVALFAHIVSVPMCAGIYAKGLATDTFAPPPHYKL